MWLSRSLWNPQRRQKFWGLRLQGQNDGSLVRNIFEDSCTEEGTVVVKASFEVLFKFAASEARKKFYSIDSSFQREEYRSEYPSNQEYQRLEVKMKHRVKWSMIQLGSDQRVIREKIQGPKIG